MGWLVLVWMKIWFDFNRRITRYKTFNFSNLLDRYCCSHTHTSINYASNFRLVFALWLPDYEQCENQFGLVGNGGLAGIIDYGNMLEQINLGMGFAGAGDDAFHSAYAEGNGANNVYPVLYILLLEHFVQTEA